MPTSAPGPGLHFGAERTGFGLASRHASDVELLLWDSPGSSASPEVLPLDRVAPSLWWREVAADCRGFGYAYRVSGPGGTAAGHRFQPSLALLDPYTPAVAGRPRQDGGRDLRGVVVEVATLAGEPKPHRAWADTVIYETHVRGLTRLHPLVPAALRGTYLGLASAPIVDHLRKLGVTAVELLPVQHHVTEARLARAGLSNYWGYSPIGFFAPHAGYATGDDGRQVHEFRAMVRALHQAGIEVIVDFVGNHTGEGPPEHPTLSLRGIDNASYYRLDPLDPTRYRDFTGCGNTLDLSRPLAQQLLGDCLRWWVERLGVDGFRLDLAPTLFRDGDGRFDPEAPLFRAILGDPVLSAVKWIVEPWDLAPDGYCLGRFPAGWAEWNDRCRDASRRFWRGDAGTAGELAARLAGSPDLFPERRPFASVNYLTCHDGFTLRDLVSYSRKHNHDNGERNRDGAAENLSRNWGVEGSTADIEVLAARHRVRESMLATLLLSRGIPMLAHGDEIGRTQHGNNNAYCHDGPLTWLDWSFREEDDLRSWVRELLAVRRTHPDLVGAPASWGDQRPGVEPALLAPAVVLRLGKRLLLLCNCGTQPIPIGRLPRGKQILASGHGRPGLGTGVLAPQSVILWERSDPDRD